MAMQAPSTAPSFFPALPLPLLPPDEESPERAMEQIAMRASASHQELCHTLSCPVSRDKMLFTVHKTTGFGHNVNFSLRRGDDQIADFDIRSTITPNRWNLWHRIVGEDETDLRFRRQGHGTRMLRAIEAYLRTLHLRDSTGDPPHEIYSTTDREDVRRWLLKNGFTEDPEGEGARIRTLRKLVELRAPDT